MKKIQLILAICLLFVLAVTIYACDGKTAEDTSVPNSSFSTTVGDGLHCNGRQQTAFPETVEGVSHCGGRQPIGVNGLYANYDGNNVFLHLQLQSIGEMISVDFYEEQYNYLFVNFKVLKDYSGILQENTVLTIPVSLAVNENKKSLTEILEYYNTNNGSVARTELKKQAYMQDEAPSSSESYDYNAKKNVNIEKERIEDFFCNSDSFIVYAHLLADNVTVNKCLTDILYFNNKNVYAVNENLVSQKKITDLCSEFGGYVNTSIYHNYDKFFYENITFADFDNNVNELCR